MSLIGELKALGNSLTESDLPAPSEVRSLIGAVVYYLETGSTVPPVAPEPVKAQDARDSQIARLEAELEAAKSPPAPTPPSPVAPPPPSPAQPDPSPLGDAERS